MKQLVMMAWVLMSFFGLSACTVMNSSFDCPNKAGVNCKSLDQINSMVDSGQIRGRMLQTSDPYAKINSNTEFQSISATTMTLSGQPVRYCENVQRIWIAPFEDNEGNYHQDSVMYAVMTDGYWSGQAEKAIRSS